jgi:hypothetical protein
LDDVELVLASGKALCSSNRDGSPNSWRGGAKETEGHPEQKREDTETHNEEDWESALPWESLLAQEVAPQDPSLIARGRGENGAWREQLERSRGTPGVSNDDRNLRTELRFLLERAKGCESEVVPLPCRETSDSHPRGLRRDGASLDVVTRDRAIVDVVPCDPRVGKLWPCEVDTTGLGGLRSSRGIRLRHDAETHRLELLETTITQKGRHGSRKSGERRGSGGSGELRRGRILTKVEEKVPRTLLEDVHRSTLLNDEDLRTTLLTEEVERMEADTRGLLGDIEDTEL